MVSAGFSRALRTYRFVQNAHRVCRQERFDVVHAVTPCLAADVYQPRGGTYAETVNRSLAMVGSPLRRGLKRLGRRFNVRQRFLMRLEQILLRKRTRRVVVAAVSDYVRRQAMAHHGFPEERVRVVYNGVEIEPLAAQERGALRAERRGELGVGEDTPVLLFVAHNFRLKGLAELLRTCAAAARPEWLLVAAGRDRPQKYQRLAQRLGLAERVRFTSPRQPVRAWYAAADLLVHPTWYDPCSRVVLEALSLGLPVVTTRFDGAAETLEAGRHGEVVEDPANVPALVAAITRALRPEVRAACSADADRLHARLSMARHARDLHALYEEIATGAAGGQATREV